MNMDFSYLKNLICTHILENQNHYAEFHFGIPDQFKIVTEYLFSEACMLGVADVVIAARAHSLRL